LNSKHTSTDHAAGSIEPGRVSWTFIGIYALAYTGIWLALLTPVIVTIALRVRQLTPEHASQKLVAGIARQLISVAL
jgi:hypothetical protein